MNHHRKLLAALACLTVIPAIGPRAQAEEDPVFPEFQEHFPLFGCHLSPRGANDYFMPLFPGYTLLLEGEEDGEELRLCIKVLRRTRVVDGVRCAIVREMEWADGELAEISWNYFAFCRKCRQIFYFGEDVDIYEDGEVVSHDGAWRSGEDGARFGLIMPCYPLVGSRYYQEVAPGVAEDRAEHLSVSESLTTPAGTFHHCLFVEESSPLEIGHFSYKTYAPRVGLVKDGPLELVARGYRVRCRDCADDGEQEED